MLRPNHSYLVVNGVTAANKIINANKLGKPSRVLFEFKANQPTVQNCGFFPEQIFINANTQATIFVKSEKPMFNNGDKWLHGAIYVCPCCGTEADMTGKP
tara:strand:+ start:1230 stop:1529 length:300 start_codon:yes stop_codon:yes gene_type:complete